MPLCLTNSPVHGIPGGQAAATALGAVAVHAAAMLVATAAVALVVYE